MKNYFIHEKAIVETEKIGKNSRIWANVHILKNAVIGKNANICDLCFIENDVKLGDDVTLKCGVYLWDGITIEDKVFVGPAAAFTNDVLPRSKNMHYSQRKTLLKTGSSIGANATILPVTVGQYALVGAGAVVTKDVPDFAVVYGNPATVQGYICICTNKLDFSINKTFTCKCGREYIKGKTVKLRNNL